MEIPSQNEHMDVSDLFEPIKLGLEFDSEEHAYEYYNKYAATIGFSVRKEYANKSKVFGYVTSRKFTCYKEGYRGRDKREAMVKKPRKETRTGCLAHMVVSRKSNEKFSVISFEEKHNHPLVPPSLAHMLPSQRNIKLSQAPPLQTVQHVNYLAGLQAPCPPLSNATMNTGLREENSYPWYSSESSELTPHGSLSQLLRDISFHNLNKCSQG